MRKLRSLANGLFVATALLAASAVGAAGAEEQAGRIVARPLFEQCAELGSFEERTRGPRAALKGADPAAKAGALSALGRSCDSQAAGLVIPFLRDPDAGVRIAAIEALGALGDRTAIEPLIEAIPDTDWRVRASLGRALCSFQVYQSNNATLNQLANPGGTEVTDEGDMRARCLAVLAINQLHDVRFSRKAIGFVLTFLNYKAENLRAIAEQTMAELKNTRNGYRELIGILKLVNYPDFRRKAAFWLGSYRIPETRDFLAELAASDRDEVVRRLAAEALSAMKDTKKTP